MEYGLQMYSVRDITKDDLAGAVRKVAQIGYKLIEFAGFFGASAEEVNAMLAENGVRVSGTHTGLNELLSDYEGTVAFHKAIGNRYYIIPGHDLSTRAKLDAFIDDVNRLQPMLERKALRCATTTIRTSSNPTKTARSSMTSWSRARTSALKSIRTGRLSAVRIR